MEADIVAAVGCRIAISPSKEPIRDPPRRRRADDKPAPVQAREICRRALAELVSTWGSVGELAMDTGKHEHIARRAYAFWQAEGQPDGRHEEHWQHAVREIEAAESANSAVKRTTRRKQRKV